MIYIQSGKAYAYKIPFMVDGELVSPSAANITIKDNAGNIVQSVNGSALTIPSGATYVVYNLTTAINTKTLDYEVRYIFVEYTYGGKTYNYADVYTLKDSVLIPVAKDDVRSILALNSTELPDDDIDLFTAYTELQNDTPDVAVGTIISSGSSLMYQAQQAIIAKAALNAAMMLELRVLQSEQADNTIYKRFSKFDLEAIKDSLTSKYNSAVAALNGEELGTSGSVTVFLTVTDTDPVTNT